MEKIYWPKTPLPANATQAGIYAILNSVTGSVYVGSSVDIDFRHKSHEQHLRRGEANSNLLKDWEAFGDDAFYFDVLECVSDVSVLREREQFWLDQVRLLRPVYNIVLQVGNPFQDPNFVEHMKQATRGKPKTPEHVAKVAEANRGKKRTPEQIAKQSERMKGKEPPNKGKKMDPSVGKKISERLKGQKISPERAEKLHDSWRGSHHTPESKAKIGATHRGKSVSIETRNRISKSQKGVPSTEELKRNVSLGTKAWWDKRKEAQRLANDSSQGVSA